jgi:hypothetical protein
LPNHATEADPTNAQKRSFNIDQDSHRAETSEEKIMKLKPWNPLWRAFDRLRKRLPEDSDEIDPIAVGGPEIVEDASQIAIHLQDWENVSSGDQYAVIKAGYLLGLAVGLKYARVSEATLDKIICNYKKEA